MGALSCIWGFGGLMDGSCLPSISSPMSTLLDYTLCQGLLQFIDQPALANHLSFLMPWKLVLQSDPPRPCTPSHAIKYTNCFLFHNSNSLSCVYTSPAPAHQAFLVPCCSKLSQTALPCYWLTVNHGLIFLCPYLAPPLWGNLVQALACLNF